MTMENPTQHRKRRHLLDRHHISDHLSPRYDAVLNYFDEEIFAHSGNGTLLAIHPRHISLSESRSLGSIPAMVKDWTVNDMGRQVMLAVTDRQRDIIFRVDIPSGTEPEIVLQHGMTLYMRLSWDKLIEFRDDKPAWQHRIPL